MSSEVFIFILKVT